METDLSEESVDKDWFRLSKSVDTENGLDVMCWIPRCIKDDDTVGCSEVDAEATSLRRNQEQTQPKEVKNIQCTLSTVSIFIYCTASIY